MNETLKIIKAVCKFKRLGIKWQCMSPQEVKSSTAYNAALEDIIDFVERYSNGKVDQDHIQHILKNYGK